jgi:hypothetical protein
MTPGPRTCWPGPVTAARRAPAARRVPKLPALYKSRHPRLHQVRRSLTGSVTAQPAVSPARPCGTVVLRQMERAVRLHSSSPGQIAQEDCVARAARKPNGLRGQSTRVARAGPVSRSARCRPRSGTAGRRERCFPGRMADGRRGSARRAGAVVREPSNSAALADHAAYRRCTLAFVARLLVRAGVSPNTVTVAGTIGILVGAVGFAARGSCSPRRPSSRSVPFAICSMGRLRALAAARVASGPCWTLLWTGWQTARSSLH